METINFPVQCFGPGFPPGGAPGQGFFKDDFLVLSGPDQAWTISAPLISLGIISGGFDHQQLNITWEEFSVFIPSPSGRQIFIQEAPPLIRDKLKHWVKKTTRTKGRFNLIVFLALIFFLLPLCLAAGLWWQKDRIVDWMVNRIPIAAEQNLGELAWKQISLIRPPTYQDTALNKAIIAIGTRLTQGSRYRYQWLIINDRSLNAFALPGGYVVIHSGLIQAADSPEELAGVLAHEIQHVEQRHSLRAFIYTLGWRALISLIIGDSQVGVWGDLAAKLGQLQFSREQEKSADEKGLEALARAEIKPEGMISFFEKISQEEGPSLSLLSTHPASTERLKYLKGLLSQRKDSFPPLSYDWKTLQAVIKY